jgi:hypothetical protein
MRRRPPPFSDAEGQLFPAARRPSRKHDKRPGPPVERDVAAVKSSSVPGSVRFRPQPR